MRTIRRAAALLLTALLLAAPVRAASAAFKDVPESHWAYESVRKAAQYDLIGGVGGGYFGTGQAVTRAQYATMLCRLMGWTMLSPDEGSFDDNQDKTAWYYSAIETAYAHGALLKLGDSCAPDAALSREEMAAMTVRALGYASLAGIVQDDCPFTDVSTNRGYIALAYRMGFIGGVGLNSYAPRSASTREQAAAVLVRVYERLRGGLGERTALYGGEAVPETAVYAESLSGAQSPIPMNPRAPLETVYAAAVKAGVGGAVALRVAPYAVRLAGGMASQGGTITQAELEDLLADDATRVYRSSRYGSSYLVHTESNGSTVVWYETAADIAEKVQLCRLLGVSAVYLA